MKFPSSERAHPARGLPTTLEVKRYIGLQSHNRSTLVKFRNIFIQPI